MKRETIGGKNTTINLEEVSSLAVFYTYQLGESLRVKDQQLFEVSLGELAKITNIQRELIEEQCKNSRLLIDEQSKQYKYNNCMRLVHSNHKMATP